MAMALAAHLGVATHSHVPGGDPFDAPTKTNIYVSLKPDFWGVKRQGGVEPKRSDVLLVCPPKCGFSWEMWLMSSLEKVAIITGAGTGIGWEVT